jgi:branched-chain amino acid transport system ATP-binding protein
VSVVGANGAGKSTLINTISRLVKPSIRRRHPGSKAPIFAPLSAPDVVARGVVQVPEGRQLFAPLTVRENLRLGFHRQAGAARTGPRSSIQGAARLRADGLFPRVAERIDQRAGTMSGGEQQMVAISRALMAGPQAADAR